MLSYRMYMPAVAFKGRNNSSKQTGRHLRVSCALLLLCLLSPVPLHALQALLAFCRYLIP